MVSIKRWSAIALGTLVFVQPASAAALANDHYGDATVIPAIPFQTTVDTTTATVSAGDPECAASSHTVWFRFTPTVSGLYTFDVNGLWNTGGPSLGVFVGTRRSAQLVSCDVALGGEDFGGVAADRVSLTAGTRYHLMVGTPGGLGDTSLPGGTMFVRAVRYVPVRVNVHVTDGRVDRVSHLLTLTGTVSCAGTYAYGSFDGFPDISATVRQVRSSLVARGTGGTWPDAGCTPSAPWAMDVQSQTAHPFKRGWAAIAVKGYECNIWECVTRTRHIDLFLRWG